MKTIARICLYSTVCIALSVVLNGKICAQVESVEQIEAEIENLKKQNQELELLKLKKLRESLRIRNTKLNKEIARLDKQIESDRGDIQGSPETPSNSVLEEANAGGKIALPGGLTKSNDEEPERRDLENIIFEKSNGFSLRPPNAVPASNENDSVSDDRGDAGSIAGVPGFSKTFIAGSSLTKSKSAGEAPNSPDFAANLNNSGIDKTTFLTSNNNQTNTNDPIADKIFSLQPATDSQKCSQLTSASLGNYQQNLCLLVYAALEGTTVKIPIAKAQATLPILIFREIAGDDSLLVKDFLLESEKVRTDKQIAASAGGNDSTSLVAKGGIPAIFGFAVERGAASSAVNGTIQTFRINPAGAIQSLTGADYFDLLVERRKTKTLDLLSKSSFALSFDTSRGVDMPMFTGDTNQLSEFSFRYEFINERNASHPRFQSAWRDFINDDAQRLLETKIVELRKIFVQEQVGGSFVFRNADLKQWFERVNQRFVDERVGAGGNDAAKADAVEKILVEELKNLPDSIRKNADVLRTLTRIVEIDKEYSDRRDDAFDEIAKGRVVTFEYINSRDPVLPDTHGLRFIYEKGFYKGLDFTFNAGMTLFNKKPADPTVKRLRDFEFSGQIDIPLRRLELGFVDDSVLSFAAKYQRLNTDIVGFDGLMAAGTKGDIALGQMKFTIPIGDTGIKLPLSMTFSNRTDLIKESDVRANFGFTLDVDSILTRLKPFKFFTP